MIRQTKHNRLRVAMNREGILFAFFWLALGTAAVYSGNAGLMILFSMMTAAAVLLCFWAHRNMQPVEVARRFPEDIYAATNAHIDVFVTNRGNVPIYGMHVYEVFGASHCIGPIYIARLDPGETAVARYMCVFDARGVARFTAFEVRSRFPVPILEWRRTIEAGDSAYVYPRIDSETNLIEFDDADNSQNPKRDEIAHRRETHTIAELRHGRRRGRILWKLSAKKGKIYEDICLRHRQHVKTSQIVIGPKNGDSGDLYERKIAQVATFCTRQARDGMCGSVRLIDAIYPYGQSVTQWRILLNALASFDDVSPQPSLQNK